MKLSCSYIILFIINIIYIYIENEIKKTIVVITKRREKKEINADDDEYFFN
jgi:hypothetical protein